MELEMVFANLELVREVMRAKRREGMVVTPKLLEFCASVGLDRMKIWHENNQRQNEIAGV